MEIDEEEEEEEEIRFDRWSLDKYRRDYDWIEELKDLWSGESLFTQELPPLVEESVDSKAEPSDKEES